MGIPTYGRTYTLLDGAFPELGASANGPGVKGNYTNEEGYMAFYEVSLLDSFMGIFLYIVLMIFFLLWKLLLLN